MANKTWAGSATNNADDPTAWTPNGVPAAGDTLAMPSDTAADSVMNVGTAGLPGTLDIGNTGTAAPATINLTEPNTPIQLEVIPNARQVLTVNAQQSGDTLTLDNQFPSGMTAAVAIAQGDTLNSGGIITSFSTLNVSGGASTTLVNAGTINAAASVSTFDTDITGTGSIFVGAGQAEPGLAEFKDSVGAGQSVLVQGNPGHDATSKLVIDNPASFMAPVQIDGPVEIDLQGLSADSYTNQNNVLTLYSGGQQVNSLNLSIVPDPADQQIGLKFEVAKTSGGVAINDAINEPTGYQVLPIQASGSITTGGTTTPSPAPQPTPTQSPPSNTTPTSPPTQISSDQSSPPPATGTPTQTPTPAPAPQPPATGSPAPASSTTTNVVLNNRSNSTASGGTSNGTATSSATTSDGTTPTPLSPAEVTQQQMVAGLNHAAGDGSTFFYDGGHLGTDFDNLGSALSGGQDTTAAVNQTITDMKQLLGAWIADPAIATGFSVPNGPTMAIPGQFLVDVINTGLKAITIGSGQLDQAYGGALSQFFSQAQSVMMTGAHGS